MVPHLKRAWGTYKCLQMQAFITFTNMSTQLKSLRLRVIKDGQTGQKELITLCGSTDRAYFEHIIIMHLLFCIIYIYIKYMPGKLSLSRTQTE